MAKRHKHIKSAKGVSVPKWKRDNFSSYRQYLNARYKAIGFDSYSQYSARREKGEIGSTRGLAKSVEGSAAPKFGVTHKQLRSIAELERIGYESQCPFLYTINDFAADKMETWLRDFARQVKKEYAGKIYSAAWTIFGKVAKELDDETGMPIWDKAEWKEWSTHMDFDKAINYLITTARAYADHEFLESGRNIGRGASVIYAVLITHVKISIVLEKT